VTIDGIATIRYLTTVSFGFGAASLLREVLAELSIALPLVVTDQGVRATGIADEVIAPACDRNHAVWFDRSPPNPTEAAVVEATEAFRAGGCDGILAIGGGSSLDLAKGVGLLATHEGALIDYAAVNGGIDRITDRVIRTVAIPTTAGTGSEVGRAAMINIDGRKLDFISPHLFPARALCDPALTFGLPPHLTAATGMDALTHCIETYLSPLVNPPADAIAIDGVERAAGWIQEAYDRLRRAVGTDPDEGLAEWVANLNAKLDMPQGLAAMGVPPDVLPRIAEHAEQDPSTETNARPVTRSDYEELLRDSAGR
jgi:4-hydroxybutyrate dehydrogenase